MTEFNRRSFLERVVGTGLAGGALASVAGTAWARSPVQQSDNDPNDPVGQGRNMTGQSDNDPSDPAGQGRNMTGQNDNDPSDRAGQGRNMTGRVTMIRPTPQVRVAI